MVFVGALTLRGEWAWGANRARSDAICAARLWRDCASASSAVQKGDRCFAYTTSGSGVMMLSLLKLNSADGVLSLPSCCWGDGVVLSRLLGLQPTVTLS